MLNLNYLFDLKDNFVNNWHKLECSQISKFLRVTMIWNSSPDKNNLVGQILYKISKLFFHHFCFPKSFIFFAGTIHFLPLFFPLFFKYFFIYCFFLTYLSTVVQCEHCDWFFLVRFSYLRFGQIRFLFSRMKINFDDRIGSTN